MQKGAASNEAAPVVFQFISLGIDSADPGGQRGRQAAAFVAIHHRSYFLLGEEVPFSVVPEEGHLISDPAAGPGDV
ncbi:MAG: hypothetical protein IKF55_05750, partial [Oscillospiraceae bacterium]|nr:hypothetical protein [Oscillospiraceae bacterium]